jgi:hypothetical protein
MTQFAQDPVARLQRRSRLERLADAVVALAGAAVVGAIGAFFVAM